MAQQVQGRALGRQQATRRRRDSSHDVTRRDPGAVGDEVLDVGHLVTAHRVDGRCGDGETGDNTVAPSAERADAALLRRDGRHRRHVRAAHEVLGHRHADDGGDGIGIEPAVEEPATRVGGDRVEREHRSGRPHQAVAIEPDVDVPGHSSRDSGKSVRR